VLRNATFVKTIPNKLIIEKVKKLRKSVIGHKITIRLQNHIAASEKPTPIGEQISAQCMND